MPNAAATAFSIATIALVLSGCDNSAQEQANAARVAAPTSQASLNDAILKNRC